MHRSMIHSRDVAMLAGKLVLGELVVRGDRSQTAREIVVTLRLNCWFELNSSSRA